MMNISIMGLWRRPAHSLARPLAALTLLLATAGAALAQAPVAASQAVTVQLAANGTATLLASSVNNGSTGSGNNYTIQKIRYGQVNEGATLTLTAPTGFTFTSSVLFASYGNPTVSSGNYSLGPCNSTTSTTKVNSILSGQNTASIVANNVNFGDPCGGTLKSLAVVAAYSANIASQAYSCAEAGSDNYVLLTATNTSGSSTRTARVTVVAPPMATISGLSPNPGAVGSVVTVSGTNLSGAAALTLNGTPVTITSASASALTFEVPAGATSGNVVVSLPCGQSLSTFLGLGPNNALAFNGVNNYVVIPRSVQTDFTMEYWMNTAMVSPSGSQWWEGTGIVDGEVGGVTDDFGTSLLNNKLAFGVGNPDVTIQSTTTVNDGRWHHIAVTRVQATGLMSLYVDGLLEASGTGSTTSRTAPPRLILGAFQTLVASFYNGQLDEVRLFTTALSQANIQADRFSTSAAVPSSQVAYYNFDQGTAGGNNPGVTSLTDQSGNGNTGTLTNFALTGTTSNFVRSFPTITGISPTSGPRGGSVLITGTNLTDATGFAFNGTAVTPFTTPTNDFLNTVTVPNAATTGPVGTASAPLTAYTGPVFTLVTDLVVSTGTQLSPTLIAAGTYNSITITGPGPGVLAGNAVLAGNVSVATSFTVQPGGGLSDGCSIISGAGSFSLGAGSILGICNAAGITSTGATGAVQVTGTRSFSTGASYGYTGAAAVTGNGLPGTVANLAINTAGNVTLTAPVAITVAVGVGGVGNLVLGGNALTLLSSRSGTALAVNSSTGAVVGNATVQRYILSTNAGLGYRHYSAPVSNTTVGDLATPTIPATTTTPAIPGFAPEVSMAAAYNTSATPSTTTPFPTVFAYDQSRVSLNNSYILPFDRGFVVPTALTTPLAIGQGYAVNIAGNQLVDFVGTLTTGDQSVALARVASNPDAGWQLLGNPYPAPLDYALVALTDRLNLDAAIYVYGSTGPYAGGYRSYVNGVGTSVLPVAQGFFVRVSANQPSGALTFRNSQRLTAPDPTAFKRDSADARPLVQLELRTSTGTLADALYAYAQAGATPAFDSQFDAEKLPNPTGLNLSSTATSGQRLAIDGRPVFDAATVLPLNVGVPAAGSYTFSAGALANLPAGLDAFLRDAQTGQTVNLRTQPAYAFSVTAAQATALLVGRFALVFAAPATALATAPALTAAQVELYPNPAHARFAVLMPGVPGASAVQAELVNSLGQVVRRQAAALPASGATLTVETGALAAGVYTLRLLAGPTTLAKRVVLY